jgi:glycosyltransferase involved in cell wall biosynthesis
MIIPVYNEEKNIEPLYRKLSVVLETNGYDYEIIFIDDGSTDSTFRELSKLRAENARIVIIKFRKNFGKATALDTAFHYAKGELLITMDGDLQDDPTEIPRFVAKIGEGFDLVSGWKYPRQDPITKILPSWFFNNLTSFITGVNLHDFNCGFKAYRKDVVKNLHLYGEMHRYIPALISWRGYKISEIQIQHHPRSSGRSKYGFSRLISGVLDLITVKFLTEYSSRPLHVFGLPGLLSFFIGFCISVYLVMEKYFYNVLIGERPLLLLSVLLILLGLQFISLGLIGEMITFRTIREQPADSYIEKILGSTMSETQLWDRTH